MVVVVVAQLLLIGLAVFAYCCAGRVASQRPSVTRTQLVILASAKPDCPPHAAWDDKCTSCPMHSVCERRWYSPGTE